MQNPYAAARNCPGFCIAEALFLNGYAPPR